MGKKRPGPEPELISLHPFTFEEVVDVLLTTKPTKSIVESIKPIKKPQQKKARKIRKQATA